MVDELDQPRVIYCQLIDNWSEQTAVPSPVRPLAADGVLPVLGCFTHLGEVELGDVTGNWSVSCSVNKVSS